MVDVARVNLYGTHVGTFRWDTRHEVAQFEYDRDFAGRGMEPSPLMMPVRPASAAGRLSRGCQGCWRIRCPIPTAVRCSTDGLR